MPKLSVILEAVDRITKPLSAVAQRLKRLNSELQLSQLMASGQKVGSAFARVGRDGAEMAKRFVASVGLIGGGLFALVKRSADAADAAGDMAARIGISAGSLQRLGWAAQMAGSNQDEMGKGVAALNKRIVAAATGNKAMAANFRRLGINVKDANGKLKPTEVVLGEIADKFKGMPDGAKKSALAMALLGNQVGLRLVPTLNGGSDAIRKAGDEFERLHGKMSDDAAAAAGNFNDALDRLFLALSGVQDAIAQKLLPILTPLIQQFTNWIATNREWIATEIGTFIGALPGYIASTRDSLKSLMTTLAPVVSMFRALVEWLGPANTAFLALGTFIAGKFLISVLQLVIALLGLGKALGITGAGILKLGASLIAGLFSPIGLVIGAVALLAGAVYLIYRNWDAVGPWFGRLWDSVADIFNGFIKFLSGVFTLNFAKAFEGWQQIGAGILSFFTTLWDGVKGLFSAFSGWVKSTFGVDLAAAFDAVLGVVRPITDTISAMIDGIASGISKVMAAKAWVTGAINDAASSFGGASRQPVAAGRMGFAGRTQVDTGGTLRVVFDDKRVRVAEALPNDPRTNFDVDTGWVMP